MVLIDCYGHEATSTKYGSREFAKTPYLVVTSGDTTYICFSATAEKQPIHRVVDTPDGVEIAWAWGQWNERETLNYRLTLNTPAEVPDDELED